MIRCLALACSIIFLLVSGPAWGITYVVAQGGSGSTCTWASPCSLQYGYQTSIAGDTVRLSTSGGNFTSYYILPTNSGTADGSYGCSAYITYEAYPGESPKIYNQAYGFYLDGKSCIKIKGIHFEKMTSRWGLLTNSADRNVIESCNFKNSKEYYALFFEDGTGTNDYNVLDSNTFEPISLDPATECGRTGCGDADGCAGCPSDMVTIEDCVSCLIINNTFGRSGHVSLSPFPGTNKLVVWGNTFNNELRSNLDTGTQGTATPMDDMVIHGNTVIGAGDNFAANPDKYSAADYSHTNIGEGFRRAIIRRNVVYSTTGVGSGISLQCGQAGCDGSEIQYNRVYNNTIYHTNIGLLVNWEWGNNQHNIWKNNIVSNSAGTYSFWGYRNTTYGYIADNTITYNDFYSPDYHRYTAPGGTVTTGNLATMQSTFPTQWLTNQAVAPAFRDTASNDYRLGTTSALKDAGTYLTTTWDSGSATKAIKVTDSYYFYSRETWQTPAHASISSDVICVDNDSIPGGNTGVWCDTIDAVTTRSDTLGVVSTVSTHFYDSGAKVYLGVSPTVAYYGTAPDIGRYEYVIDAAPTLGDPTEGSSQTTSPTLNLTRVGQVSVPVGDTTYTHTASQWQVRASGGIFYDSGEVTGASMTAIVPTGLSDGQTCYWKARTKNSDGWGQYSAEKSFITSGTSPTGSGGAVLSAPGTGRGGATLTAPGTGKGGATLTGPP